HFAGALHELEWIVVVFTLKNTGEGAACVQFDMPEVGGRVHMDEEIAPFCVLLGTPRQIAVFRIDDSQAALLTTFAAAQCPAAFAENLGIGTEFVAGARRKRQRVLSTGINGIFR